MEEVDSTDMQIRTGSVVRLKSGGPLMTVSNIVGGSKMFRTKEKVICNWICSAEYSHSEQYHKEQLIIEKI